MHRLRPLPGTSYGMASMPISLEELMLAWNCVRCRPPLEDEEVIRTVRSIECTHARGNEGSPPHVQSNDPS